jgi:glycosyltransferase involved in cell wall biosynthesis
MEAEHVIGTPQRSTRLMFDVTDLIQYMRDSRVPTGIQRVQLKIIFFALTEFKAKANPIVVYFNQAESKWIPVEADLFLSLHNAAESGDEILEENLQEIMKRLAHPDLPQDYLDEQLQQNDFILVNLGTSWWIENYFLKLRELRKKYGIRYVPMIHDVIPLMTPEHCSQPLVEEFCQWFSTLPFEVDGAVTNSHWSAMDIRHRIAEFLPQAVFPVYPIALNGDMRRDISTRSVTTNDTIRYLIPPNSSFVLCVGTLESRKNHLLLFRAWERLLANHDAADVPVLVCLGKAGWLFDEAAEFLRARPALSAKIMLISSVTDQSLAALYQECLFTISNSFYEGWGLPITESISFGALPLIPCHTSLTEAGGRAAVYFRDDDLDDLSAKLETLIFSVEERKRLSDHARANSSLRSWKEVAREFVDTILNMNASASARQEELMRVPIGRIVHIGKSNALIPSVDLAMANLLRDGLNWHKLEYWGTWTRPGIATIRLPLPDNVIGQDLIMFMRFGGTAVDTPIIISCWLDDQRLGSPIQQVVGRLSCHSVIFRLKAQSRHLSVTIDAGVGSSLGFGDRDAGIGVTHLMLSLGDDIVAQNHFMDAFQDLYRPIVNGAHVSLHQI